MSRIVDCLTLFHDIPMTALALLICVVGCLSTAVVASRGSAAPRGALWALLIGLCFGATAWSTHFVAMLAYRLSVPIAYGAAATMLSLVIGLCIVTVGFSCALALRRHLAGRLLGGAAVGAGVLALHYTGMSGVRFAGSFVYAADLVLLSVVFGLGFGMAAIAIMFAPSNDRRHQYAGSALLLLMTLTLHFTGMGAVEISLGPVTSDGVRGWERGSLVAGVVVVQLMVLLIVVSAALLDRRTTNHLTHLARHDALTELPNRRYFDELCDLTIARAKSGRCGFAVFVIDLDDFKAINDGHGHAAGDRYIRTVARRLAGLLRESDVLARVGGDEFALIQRDLDPDDGATRRLSAAIHASLALPVSIGEVQVNASASIGIARYPHDGHDMEQLLRDADVAMYRSKTGGKGSSVFFEPSMNAALESRRRLEARLRLALSNASLSVHYQPQVSSERRQPVCCEALLRWNDEQLGCIDPQEFVPVAESSGLIVAIGQYVLERACHDAMSWPDPVRVAVNLSAAQFAGERLVQGLRGALQRSGLPAARLELEITEALLVEDAGHMIDVLGQLRQLGVRIVLDDFGTGRSSLHTLQSVEFEKIKIDRSVVIGIETDPAHASTARAAIAMARSLGMRVVAEGVDTQEQARLLSELRCDQLQGFLIARPMAADNLLAFLGTARLSERPVDSLGDSSGDSPGDSPGNSPGNSWGDEQADRAA